MNIVSPLSRSLVTFIDAGATFANTLVPKAWELLVMANPKDEKRIREELLNDRAVDALSGLTDSLEQMVDKMSDQSTIWRRLSFDLADQEFIVKAAL